MRHTDVIRDLGGAGPRLLGTLAMVALSLAVSACGSSNETDPGSDGSSRVSVVASTNVWGDVAKTVGGDAVTVTSLISGPSVDPHSFEASSTTLLAVSKADVVVENGGGYDDFMSRMLTSSDSEASVLDAVEISGKKGSSGSGPNEHVWYDLPTVAKVADAIAQELGDERPDQAGRFTARASDLTARIRGLRSQESRLRKQVAGDRIAITEPVPLYLTEAAGLVNATPEDFSEAVEEGDDVSPLVLRQTLDLFTERKVVALVYNEQTSGAVTDDVVDSARTAGIPIVPVTETLPGGMHYVGWMQQNLTRLQDAVASR
jgi:zinc/manganese transport system substrate-binding protein